MYEPWTEPQVNMSLLRSNSLKITASAYAASESDILIWRKLLKLSRDKGRRCPVLRIRIRDEQPGSYFRELNKQFFGFIILKFFDVDPGWKKIWSGIRRKHPGSATLAVPVLLFWRFVSVQSFTLLQETSLISDGEEPRQYKLLTASETAYIYTRCVNPLDSGWVQIGYYCRR